MWIDPSWDEDAEMVVRTATAQGAVMRFADILDGGVVQVHNEAPLSSTPPGLVPQPYTPGKTAAILRFKGSTLVIGYVGGLKAGVDYQTPLEPGVDYQTPLESGVDYEPPLLGQQLNPWWSSRSNWGVIDWSKSYQWGKYRCLQVYGRAPTTAYSMAASSGVVVANITNPDALPPSDTTFAWRCAQSNQNGSGVLGTNGDIVISTPVAITLPASGTVVYTINFLKP